MSGAGDLTGALLLPILVLLILAPGNYEKPPLERPKKGFWQARDVLWPVRKTWRSLWPVDPQLMAGYRFALTLAWLVAGLSDILAKIFPNFFRLMSPSWPIVEVALLGVFFGRASGFWSADRKLQKKAATQEAASPKS